jgi:dsRNA-specific ribonuclease
MFPLSLQNYLNVSIGDANQGIQNSASVLEDLFESIICAIFLDSGKSLKTVKTVINRLLGVDVYLNENEKNIQISYKNSVQEWCQKYGFHIPEYEIIQTAGGFVAVCKIEELGLICESIECHKRKDAEKAAAKGMLEILYDIEPSVKNDIEMTSLLNKPITLSGANENNCKNTLQEYCDKNKYPHPTYVCISETLNSDNSHTFTVICTFNGQSAEGSAPTKKGAEKEAAHNILKKLGIID